VGTGIKELGRSRTFKCQRSAGGLVGWFYCQLSASDILPGNPADVFKLVRRTTAGQTCGNQVRKRGVADVSAAGGTAPRPVLHKMAKLETFSSSFPFCASPDQLEFGGGLLTASENGT